MNAKILKQIKRRAGGRCEARIECAGVTDVLTHHRKRAGRLDSVANCMRLCSDCHVWIHANPERSYELGLLVHSWDEPELTSILPVRSIPVITLQVTGVSPIELGALFNAPFRGEVA